jgi:Protein of unknown function (DUF3396)
MFKNFDFAPLHIRTILSGHDHLLVRPGVTLTFYLDEPLAVICPAVADLIEYFISIVPRATLRSYIAKDGFYKPLTDRQIKKDLKTMRKIPTGYQGFSLDYTEAELGQVGTHAVFFEAVTPSANRPDVSNLVRLEFPETIFETLGEVQFLQVIADAAAMLPFFSGHAGFAFKRSLSLESESLRAIAPLLTRYLGFDTSDYWMATRMRGHTVTCHWINLLGPQLCERLGDVERIRTVATLAEIKLLRKGLWIRGARFPPIGDVNRGATDIGQLPDVARLLRSVRCPNPRTGHENFDISAWLSRFDDLDVKVWDNS